MNNTHLPGCSLPPQKAGMTAQQVVLVQKSWKLFRHINPQLVGTVFYSRLFIERPALKRMFKSPMTDQYRKLTDMISVIVGRLQHPEEISNDIKEMARRHAGYGVKPAHYKAVGACLLWTLEQGLGNDWNEEVKQAWANCYELLADTMIEASK